MPKGSRYRLDLRSLSDEEYVRVDRLIDHEDCFDHPVVGVPKNLIILWLSDRPIAEALGIPVDCVHPVP